MKTNAPAADLVIGGVLIPGAAAPKLVTRAMLKDWKPGSVLVDVAIDQGGCAETSKATTHAEPTYVVDGVIHYCVANMPGGVARTSTYALNNVTLPFALAIANKGWKKALADDAHLKNGLNVAHRQGDLQGGGRRSGLRLHRARQGRSLRRGQTPNANGRELPAISRFKRRLRGAAYIPAFSAFVS